MVQHWAISLFYDVHKKRWTDYRFIGLIPYPGHSVEYLFSLLVLPHAPSTLDHQPSRACFWPYQADMASDVWKDAGKKGRAGRTKWRLDSGSVCTYIPTVRPITYNVRKMVVRTYTTRRSGSVCTPAAPVTYLATLPGIQTDAKTTKYQ